MLDVVILVDPVGMVIYLNPAADRLFGSLRLASSMDALFAAVHPDDFSQLRSAIDEALNGGLSTATVEHRCRAALGGWRVFETQVQRVMSEGVDSVLIVARDVSAQRADQNRRSEAHAFEVAAQASGAVARDFGALLLALGRHLDVLAGASMADVPTEMRELRETLDSGWRIVDELQSFGTLDTGPHSTEVNDTLEDLSPHLQRLAGPSVEVVQLLGATTGRIAMSRGDLEELLAALVLRGREAIRAAGVPRPGEPVGAGRIVIVTSDGAESAGRNGQPAPVDTVIELTDTGLPMTPEDRAQLESGVRGEGDGRLARIHALVLKAGGTVRLDVGPEVGTTVRIRCPLAAAAS